MSDDYTWGDCSSSEYLKKDDFSPTGETCTIEAFEKRLIEGRNGEADKTKLCVKFKEHHKMLVLNATNGDAIRLFTKSDLPADSIGKKVHVYRDDAIPFGGKIVGGVRIKTALDQSDDIPFDAA